jgi:hypothetical protein
MEQKRRRTEKHGTEEAKPAAEGESPKGRFANLARRLVRVPKKELVAEEAKYRQGKKQDS